MSSGWENNSQETWRLILVGKTGVGKSASGNTILEREEFKSELGPSSVTDKCQKAEGTIGDRQITVIDTPGLFDTNMTEDQVVEQIKKCIALSVPGPHAYVICVQLGRFTKEEKDTVKLIQLIFGEEAANYTMVLFTRGDDLGNNSIESFTETNNDLSELIQTCHNRYHVFNNKIKDKKQIDQFFNKIEKMIQENGGKFHTNDMFKKAEEAMMKPNGVLIAADVFAGTAIGAQVGAVAGFVFGPPGALIGVIIGGVSGGATGGVVGGVAKKPCVIQ